MTKSPPLSDHIPALDGIRGLAIILVLILHSFSFTDLLDPIGMVIQKVALWGWTGVDLFFVLSGFLITRILLRVRGSKRNMINFYFRRALRIFPLYFAAILVLFVLIPLFLKIETVPGYQYLYKHQYYFWFYIHNWLFAFFGKYPNFPFVWHFWSLALEEQYYLLWPTMVFLLSNRNLRRLCLVLMVVCLVGRCVWSLTGGSWYSIYVHTLTRFDTLIYGSYAALLVSNENKQSLLIRASKKYFYPLLLATIISLTVFKKPLQAPIFQIVGFSLLGILFSMLIINTYYSSVSNEKTVFDNSLMRFFGKYSYGMYVFHWPIFLLIVRHVIVGNPDIFTKGGPYFGTFFILIIGTLLTVGVSTLSYHLFENHFLKLKRYFPNQES